MKLQNTIRGSRPDVHLKRLDAAAPEVVVFLDGFKYHASVEYNRLADDADKRARLRAHDYIVLGITWEDVDYWGTTAEDSSWAPYRGLAQQAARSFYRQLVPDSEPNDLERYVWTNPVELLMHFLADPDPRLWCRRADAALAGMLRLPAEKTAADSSGIGGRILAALTYLSWESVIHYINDLKSAHLTLVYLTGAGHNTYQDKPDEYRDVVAAFITGSPIPYTYTSTDKPNNYLQQK
jgi:pimeloyl-ACP methyl ester carboxylesterase